MVDYGEAGKSELEIVCCDIGVMRRVLGMMSEEWIDYKGLCGLIKLGATELEAMKLGVTQHCLPS
jgi:hypothetical protein